MPTAQQIQATRQKPVTVFLEDSKARSQPATFRCCPMGIQFYADRALSPFEMIECTVCIPGARGRSEKVNCLGAIVNSAFDKEVGRYRIWVKFLDLPKSKQARLKCLAKAANLLCPNCGNF